MVGTSFNSHVLKLLADIETALEHAAVDHVFKLCTHECVAFAGLYVEELHAEVKTAIHADAGAVLDVLSVNHKMVVLEFCRKDTHFFLSAKHMLHCLAILRLAY